MGVVNLSKSVARGFPAWNPCDGHLVILITCPKFDSLLNELELSISVLLFNVASRSVNELVSLLASDG